MQNNDFDVRAARERLGLTPEALAAELSVTEGEVRAWEGGTIRVPAQMRRWMEWYVARAEWDAHMEASGLPACGWVADARDRVLHATGSSQIALAKELVAHMEACTTCQARNAWARENLPPPPDPPATGAARLIALIGRLPGWARPATFGAVALFLMTAVRILFPAVFRSPLRVLEALGVAFLAAAAGAVGGFAYSLTRPSLARLGTPGDYLSGIVATAAYVGAVAAVAALLGEPIITDLPGTVIFAFCSVLFGVVVGKFIHDARQTAPRQP